MEKIRYEVDPHNNICAYYADKRKGSSFSRRRLEMVMAAIIKKSFTK